MHRHARGLVDGQDRLVLKQDGKFAGGRARDQARVIRRATALSLQPCGRGLRGAHWGNAHRVARRQAGVRLGTGLVHPHLARADEAVDMGLGHPLEVPKQEVVQALPFPGLVDHHLAHGRLAYNRARHVCVPFGIRVG